MITANLTGNFGNHMWSYAICRVVAEKIGYEWGINHSALFDYHGGMNQMYFMNIDFGSKIDIIGRNEKGLYKYDGITNEYYDVHKHHRYNNDSCLINMYDPNVFNVKDNTMIHLISQSDEYLFDRKSEILKWFTIKDEYQLEYQTKMNEIGLIIDDNTCVINFRGGEYNSIPNLIPNRDYWKNSISHMLSINSNIKFVVITDDIKSAKNYIGEYACYHIDIGFDFFTINKAKYVILSNSSFGWWASWLNTNSSLIIAPKYWARHNLSNGYWSLGDQYTRGFMYMDREGLLSDYEKCKLEATEFYKKNNLL